MPVNYTTAFGKFSAGVKTVLSGLMVTLRKRTLRTYGKRKTVGYKQFLTTTQPTRMAGNMLRNRVYKKAAISLEKPPFP